MMQRTRFAAKLLCTAMLLSLTSYGWAAPETIPQAWQATYDKGVTAYRDGDFKEAHKRFQDLTQAVPEAVEGQYYFAITLAQLGRFKEARVAYQAVIRMAPESDAARLAQQGIDYLPQPDALDSPPLFKRSAQAEAKPAAVPSPSEYVQSNMAAMSGQSEAGNPAGSAAPSPFGNMDPQTLQMMMLMGSMGGGGGNGLNPAMIPLMQGMTRGQGADGQNAMPPEAFSTMMMNQMLNNFDFSPGKDD